MLGSELLPLPSTSQVSAKSGAHSPRPALHPLAGVGTRRCTGGARGLGVDARVAAGSFLAASPRGPAGRGLAGAPAWGSGAPRAHFGVAGCQWSPPTRPHGSPGHQHCGGWGLSLLLPWCWSDFLGCPLLGAFALGIACSFILLPTLSQPGWILFGQSAYYMSSTTKTWQESRDHCRSLGTDLMIINSKEEQGFANGFKKYMWIGLTDSEEEGRWKWVDGTPMNTNYWSENEPNGKTGENCADIKSFEIERSWNDESCSSKVNWICEMKLNP
uniref:C-type lectin domain-containing protein n=1 Tax=Cyprinodon variegatus TaxID=28743 RepID=A0A3Q2CAG9_CYPVA